MQIRPLSIPGMAVLDSERRGDARGWFQRAYCGASLEEAGLPFPILQANLSFNAEAMTLRGLHYQASPLTDPKIVRAIRGRCFDVAVDIRPDSPTRGRWEAVELSAENGLAVLIPGGCAHGFLTLEPDTELLYLMGAEYRADLARGLRWDDPAFTISWPDRPAVINARDAAYPDWTGWGP